MATKKDPWPERGDLVIATITRLTVYGAYAKLDEYDKEGLLHISEVASSWVRNLRDFVREGKKVVLKVLRVNAEKAHVDLSLRRVTKRERIEKQLSWKKERKAEGILRSTSQKLNLPLNEIVEKAGTLLEKEFGDLHDGLEKTAKDGVDVLLKLGIPQNIATTLEGIAKEKINPPSVTVKGILELQCTKPKGVLLIKDALLKAQNIKKPHGTDVNIYVVSPPQYRIVVSAEDYKSAETLLLSAAETAVENVTKIGAQGTFTRQK